MKLKVFLFLIVFASGAVTGYFAAQKEVQSRAHQVLMKFGSMVEDQIARLLQSVLAGGSSSGASVNSTPTVPSPPVSDPPSPEFVSDYLRNHLQVINLQAARDGTAAVISGSITNSGTRPIRRVIMSIYFMGPDDILHETQLPVLTESSLEPDASKEFTWRIDAVPAAWTGRIRGAITDIAF